MSLIREFVVGKNYLGLRELEEKYAILAYFSLFFYLIL